MHTHAQCSPASEGLTQAHPNQYVIPACNYTLIFSHLQTEFTQGSHVPKSDSFWRPVPYEVAFKNTSYFHEDRANKGYIILQHWAEWDRPQPDDYRNGRYFVVEFYKDKNEWKYYLGPLGSCSLYGLFVF